MLIGCLISVAYDRKCTRAPGLLLLIQVLSSTQPFLRHPQTKLISLMLLLQFGLRTNDEAILERVIPTVTSSLDDPLPQIRAMALRCLSALLQMVEKISPLESNYFPQFIFPLLNTVSKDQEVCRRVVIYSFLFVLGTFTAPKNKYRS